MAAKNSVKEFVSDGIYHIYNRGVEKRLIFMDDQDRAVFLSYLKTYLLPKNKEALQRILANSKSLAKEKDVALKQLRMNNFSDTLTLLAYCQMPNHFHFLVKQTDATIIDQFMNSFGVRYCTYFNRKYRRVGSLFQGVYKAVRVTSDEQLLHLSRYIHRNPIALATQVASQDHLLRSYTYSSYPQYLGLTHAEWIHAEDILSYFSKSTKHGYQEFVEGPSNGDGATLIAKYIIDDDDDA